MGSLFITKKGIIASQEYTFVLNRISCTIVQEILLPRVGADVTEGSTVSTVLRIPEKHVHTEIRKKPPLALADFEKLEKHIWKPYF